MPSKKNVELLHVNSASVMHHNTVWSWAPPSFCTSTIHISQQENGEGDIKPQASVLTTNKKDGTGKEQSL